MQRCPYYFKLNTKHLLILKLLPITFGLFYVCKSVGINPISAFLCMGQRHREEK